MKVELNKKYRYRNGEPARVLCVDAPGSQKVVTVDSAGTLHKHWGGGSYLLNASRSDYDLIEVREPLECWVCITPKDDGVHFGCAYTDKPNAPFEYRLFREVIE